MIRLGQSAADWWGQHTTSLHRRGSLVISPARDNSDLTRFARRTTSHQTLTGAEIAAFEPDLGDRFAKGLYFQTEAHLSPRIALAELWRGLVADGASFEQGEAAPEALAQDGIVVDCRGYHARADLPELRGVKGEMALLSCPDIEITRPIRVLHPRVPIYLLPRGDGIYMLGATMVEGRAGAHASVRSVLELLSAAYALSPAFGEAEILEIGVDSRPAFPDNLPRIERQGNLIRANGLYRHGFLLAPALATMVADLILEAKTPEIFHETTA